MRLTLPFKVIGIVGVVMLAYAAGNYVLQRHFVLQEFTKLEAENAQRDDDRVDEALQREQDAIGQNAADWGNWSDLYEYMQTRNPAIPERDLSVSSMDGLGADYVALVDTAGQLVWSRSLHPETRSVLDPPPIASTVMVTWKSAMLAGEQRSGMIRTAQGAMLVGLGPMLNGEGEGPLRGSIIVGRYVTAKVIAELAQRTKLDFTLTLLPEGSKVPAIHNSAKLEFPDHLEMSHSFDDIEGAPLLLQTVHVPRDLMARGKDTVKLAAVSILLAAMVSLLVLVVLLRRLVLQPLSRVSDHVQRIGSTDDLTQRLSLRAEDEIGQLAAGIDSMVTKLQEARARLVERSYEAGAAEMVRGTLHNVGNALTPMSVHSANISSALRAAPLADIDMALQEMGNAGDDAARVTELRRFASLAVSEVGTQFAQAAQCAEDLQRSADSLQDLLRLQMGASRQEQIVDRASIATLLEETTRLCPPDRIQRIRVETDPALHELQPERVPVMLLKQVFQNLIINAAEALPAGQTGVMRVGGARVQDSGGTWLQVTFADNGSGIAMDALHRVFEKGFSTKSAKRNSGIGLHWCANAMASIGGSITVDSKGPGHGATFTLRVPIDLSKEQAA